MKYAPQNISISKKISSIIISRSRNFKRWHRHSSVYVGQVVNSGRHKNSCNRLFSAFLYNLSSKSRWREKVQARAPSLAIAKDLDIFEDLAVCLLSGFEAAVMSESPPESPPKSREVPYFWPGEPNFRGLSRKHPVVWPLQRRITRLLSEIWPPDLETFW